MRVLVQISVLLPALFLLGCAGVDRESGQALGLAGQSAAQALADQSNAARRTIDVLPEWWGVHDALVCANVRGEPGRTACLDTVRAQVRQPQPATPLSDAQRNLSIVMAKRTAAAAALRDAYGSFVNLAVYDAGAETEQAIEGAVGAINELTKAAATIAPQGVALSAISSTFTTVASGVGGFIAGKRQEQLMLAASRDLHSATDAMIAALTVESDVVAAESLLSTLRAERDELYSTFVQSGLVSSRDALAPLLAQVAPGSQMVQTPPAANADVIATAALISLSERSRREQQAVVRSYEASLAALKALSAEHAKLESDQPIDIATILAHAKRIEAILLELKQSS